MDLLCFSFNVIKIASTGFDARRILSKRKDGLIDCSNSKFSPTVL